MAKYQAYAEYKDSGVEWLGEIPTHWDVQPTKRFFRLIAEPAPEYNDYELLSVYTEIGVKPRKELEQKGNKASTTDGYWLVKKGDIVVNKLLAWMGAVGYSEYDGVTSPAYDILRPTKKLNPKFYHYLFRTKIANMEFKRWSRGIMEMRLRLYFDELGRITMPFPTFKEQNEIVNFLDHETAKIDQLIEKQQQLIELLKEKRQAVISHAVTKGLDPNVLMKDSGVEWLGEVPEHWEIRRLKTIICSLESGCSVNAADIPAQSHELGVLKTSCVYTRSFRVEENKTVVPEDIQRVKCKVRKGSIIISRMNTPELVGASALVKVKADNIYLPDRLWQTIFFENIEIDAEYLSHFMTVQGFRDQIALGAEGASSSMQNIAKEDYLNINCLLPPLKEQILIREFIEQKLSILNHLNIKAQEAVDRLKERRTALISAAVTGKIDVRNWQAPSVTEADTELSA